tara:strand:- start:578 stop:799 length:222 start_codon:yes stop_codon:yes gene_type:complete
MWATTGRRSAGSSVVSPSAMIVAEFVGGCESLLKEPGPQGFLLFGIEVAVLILIELVAHLGLPIDVALPAGLD